MRDSILKKMVLVTAPIYSFIKKRNKKDWGIFMKDLKDYPKGSLGQKLYEFLTRNNIEPIAKFEYHDIYHLLTGYDITPVDEARMQFFLVGNGKRSLYAIGTMLVAIILLPEHIKSFYYSYQRGKSKPRFYQFLNCKTIAKKYRRSNSTLLSIPFPILKKSLNL